MAKLIPLFTDWAERLLGFGASLPLWPTPSLEKLRACRIVAHRGDPCAQGRKENTLASFRDCADNGVWGIELDVRWTKDDVPIVLHDADAGRVFHKPHLVIAQSTFAQVRALEPLIPSLEEVIAAVSPHCHLMIELKEPLATESRLQKFKTILSGLKPGENFHLLALDPSLFARIDFLPASFLVLVAELNVSFMSQAAKQSNFGGFAGHFFLITGQLLREHQMVGRKVGVGFVASRANLFRELGRGVDWIFSNNAIEIQHLVTNALTQRGGQ